MRNSDSRTAPQLRLPQLQTGHDIGLVLEVASIQIAVAERPAQITIASGEVYSLPPGVLQDWATTSRRIAHPCRVEFGVLPNGREYAEYLFDGDEVA